MWRMKSVSCLKYPVYFPVNPIIWTVLTVGTTEDPTISRMTIATVSDDETFEQIKKQLNRLVEVIKVIDFTDIFVRMKEILYVKVRKCTPEDKVQLFQIAETFKARVIDYGRDSLPAGVCSDSDKE